MIIGLSGVGHVPCRETPEITSNGCGAPPGMRLKALQDAVVKLLQLWLDGDESSRSKYEVTQLYGQNAPPG